MLFLHVLNLIWLYLAWWSYWCSVMGVWRDLLVLIPYVYRDGTSIKYWCLPTISHGLVFYLFKYCNSFCLYISTIWKIMNLFYALGSYPFLSDQVRPHSSKRDSWTKSPSIFVSFTISINIWYKHNKISPKSQYTTSIRWSS